MTSIGEQVERRWNRIWATAPYAVLLFACVVEVLTGTSVPRVLVTLGIAAALAAWHGWFVLGHPAWWDRLTWMMAVYYVGVLAFTTLLLSRSDAFEVFLPMCFLLAFAALPGWPAYPAVLTANVPWLIVSEEDPYTKLVTLAMSTSLAVLIGGMMRTMEREAIRRRMVNSELVAMAAENARLHELLLSQAREAGITEERARIAREIHDTVAQGLTGIVTQLEVAADAVPAPVRHRLVTARNLARTSLVEVRRSIEALRPGPLQDARLGDAVRQAVTTWHEQYHVPASFTVTGTPLPVHSEVEVTVLRAAQEALANVGRHAAATRVAVTLSYMEDVIVLDVRDDGRGFDPSAATGFGLTALRQRVAALSGHVDVESAPGAGTAVGVSVPVIEVDR
ncbi:sensor histidine kinase [Saccharothrix violaceirubra]|uniref:Oxygen sensor histidine kinase NreB n=1 Tax=Saccharothrix violaceirubra TaxID=413306 RepID=A0A7W7T6D0_9PSEU|nr:sensor histidine kinase [Saccharothrix violaceirubra]MBB4967403.1 signal transduction histidine kinase [Saccharothrix violaceirubra]